MMGQTWYFVAENFTKMVDKHGVFIPSDPYQKPHSLLKPFAFRL